MADRPDKRVVSTGVSSEFAQLVDDLAAAAGRKRSDVLRWMLRNGLRSAR